MKSLHRDSKHDSFVQLSYSDGLEHTAGGCGERWSQGRELSSRQIVSGSGSQIRDWDVILRSHEGLQARERHDQIYTLER